MNEVFDYGTGVLTHTRIWRRSSGESRPGKKKGPTAARAEWFDAASCELCRGPVTCQKWAECGKCCPSDGQDFPD